jgi:hypothetical protein
MGATTPRLAKVRGPRGEVRVNSEKRWLKGTPKTKMPAGEAGTDRKLLAVFQLATARQRGGLGVLQEAVVIVVLRILFIECAYGFRFGGGFDIFFNVGQP